MTRYAAYRRELFLPLQDKELESVMIQLFVNEFGYENKVIFAEAMVRRILETLYAFLRPSSFLKPGQLLWMAVANDGQKHGGQPMREIPQVPVVLDMVTRDDLQQLARGEKFITVRRQRNARLLQQAFKQGGVLSQSDLACITLVSRGLVGLDIGYFQKTEHRLLPYRGTVQDTGGTVTHKAEAIHLFENGHLEPDICKLLSPAHTLAAVENYVQSYKNVLKLLRREFSPLEISGILAMSKALVGAYVEIACEHHPDIVEQNPYVYPDGNARS